MTREAWIWLALAALSLLWCVLTSGLGGGLLVPGLMLGLSALCAGNGDVRRRVSGSLGRVFSGPALRTGLILVAALLLVQMLPLEMALLLAGDALAYVEVVAAVSLIAANTRLKPLMARARARARVWTGMRPRRTARTARANRAPRRPATFEDPDGRGLAFA